MSDWFDGENPNEHNDISPKEWLDSATRFWNRNDVSRGFRERCAEYCTLRAFGFSQEMAAGWHLR